MVEAKNNKRKNSGSSSSDLGFPGVERDDSVLLIDTNSGGPYQLTTDQKIYFNLE